MRRGGAEWSLLDAVYMTVITVGTVGYGETHDLGGNPAARAFTAAYIILSLGPDAAERGVFPRTSPNKQA